MKLTVVIPVCNGADSQTESQTAKDTCVECIVVDDGSTDDSAAIATRFGATVLSTGGRCGPAVARNLAARNATGDVLWFVDADVAVHRNALGRIVQRFHQEPELAALIGAYDDAPACPGFVSQFKNLMHAFVHRQGSSQTFSFWCGCGAVKRSVYLQHGGLDEAYAQPSIEDIEFGYRLMAAGHKLALDPQIQGKHMKTWTLWHLIRTDVLQRGIPWTKLILRTRFLPDDLNLQWQQRVSAVFSLALVLLLTQGLGQFALKGTASYFTGVGIAGSLLLIVWLNHRFYAFLAARKSVSFALASIPMHILYFLYSGLASVLGLGSHLLRHTAAVPQTMPVSMQDSDMKERTEW